MALLAPLHFQHRFHPRQLAHLLLGLGQVPLDPVPVLVLQSDYTLGMIDPTHEMLVLVEDSCATRPRHQSLGR